MNVDEQERTNPRRVGDGNRTRDNQSHSLTTATGAQRQAEPAKSRFLRFVDKTDGCWLWTGAIQTHGYGSFGLAAERTVLAHRFSWEVHRGPIPNGLTIDHLCRVRRCVRPSHLQPVTDLENRRRGNSPWFVNARKTRCDHGHEYAHENTVMHHGKRNCRECINRVQRERYARRQAEIGRSGQARSPYGSRVTA